MATVERQSVEPGAEEVAATTAASPSSSRLRLVLGAIALAAFFFWLGARLGPSTIFEPGGALSTGTWLPTPVPAEAYIGGAVAHPALYLLPSNARVATLVRLAAGATRDADLCHANIAAPVRDGQTITAPRRHGKGCT